MTILTAALLLAIGFVLGCIVREVTMKEIGKFHVVEDKDSIKVFPTDYDKQMELSANEHYIKIKIEE